MAVERGYAGIERGIAPSRGNPRVKKDIFSAMLSTFCRRLRLRRHGSATGEITMYWNGTSVCYVLLPQSHSVFPRRCCAALSLTVPKLGHQPGTLALMACYSGALPLLHINQGRADDRSWGLRSLDTVDMLLELPSLVQSTR